MAAVRAEIYDRDDRLLKVVELDRGYRPHVWDLPASFVLPEGATVRITSPESGEVVDITEIARRVIAQRTPP